MSTFNFFVEWAGSTPKPLLNAKQPRPTRSLGPLLSTLLCLSALVSCTQEEPTPSPTPTATPAPTPFLKPETCDAGEETFVARLMPLVWGRRAHGLQEIQLWAELSRRYGRETVVEAMTYDEAYQRYWTDWLTDALGVARIGDRAFASCYSQPLLEDSSSDGLARFIRDNGPQARYSEPFNMADVLRSSLVLDDLSVPYRAHLFARMAKPLQGANVGPYEMEDNRRTAFGDEFFTYYLNRNLTCLACHNSEYSTTGDEDPNKDRTWEMPGHFEKALLSSSFGIDRAVAYQPFRYRDLMDRELATESPWGLFSSCGTFVHADALPEDFLDQRGYFISDLGESGSVWQVEAYLAEGVKTLGERGLVVGSDLSVEGPSAFAWLLAASIADQVWEEATGSKLTIAISYARNQAQRDRLQHLTETLATQHFSLRALLKAVAMDPYFNQGAPESCGARPYGLDAVFNPWSPSELDPERKRNSAGDMAHRLKARALVRAVHDSLGWAQPQNFLASSDPLLKLQLELGAFMKTGQPGFNGTDFQGALAFEATYGACQPPSSGGAGDGCRETLGHGGCASCNCQSCTCGVDAYCCDVQWDAICVSICNDQCGGCGGGLAGNGQDYVDRLLEAARNRNATVGEVVLALKDRLIARGEVEAEEQALVEALLSVGLQTPLADAGELEPALRVLCGAVLLSPDYFLSLDLPVGKSIPTLALDQETDCQRAVSLMAQVKQEISCEGGTLK